MNKKNFSIKFYNYFSIKFYEFIDKIMKLEDSKIVYFIFYNESWLFLVLFIC